MRYFAALFLAAVIPPTLNAATGCPGDVKAIPLQRINQHQMVLQVSINHSGPYDFLVDTGSQMTIVDQTVAADLHIATTGKADVAGVSFGGTAMRAQLDTLEVGDHEVTGLGVLVYDMKGVRDAGFGLHGLLGEDFLSRFDVFIDRAHNFLCIDDTGAMLDGMTARASR
jgi:predicted aspartyl protease